MEIYAIVVSIIAVILAVLMIKWRISAHAMILFCVEKFREPTNKEIADCAKRAVSKMFKGH